MNLKGLGLLQNHAMPRPNTPFKSANLALSICYVCIGVRFLFRQQNRTFLWSDNNTLPCFIMGSLKVAEFDWSKNRFLIVDWLRVTRADCDQLSADYRRCDTNNKQFHCSVHKSFVNQRIKSTDLSHYKLKE